MNQNLQKNKSFFDRWARTYDFSLFQFWMKKFQAPVLKEINFSKKAKILDISCGTGELLASLRQKDTRHNLKLYGTDLSSKMLEKARVKLPEDIILTAGDVHQLPFKSNAFEYVISTEAFHHYGNQQKAVQEMVRVTKPGGKVVVVDINLFLRPIHKLFEVFEPGCVKINSKNEMHHLFRNTGLKEIKQERIFLFAVMTVGIKR